MASYSYEGLKISDKSRHNGIIAAASEKEARELLREQNLIVTKLVVIANADKDKKAGNPVAEFLQNIMGVSAKDRIAFTRNLGMMIRAGIPVTEALLYFENFTTNKVFRQAVNTIRQDILGGYAFSQALSKHKKIFNDVYVNVTKAGERAGELDQTMTRLTHLLIKEEKLKGKVISAMVYPIIVVFILCLVLLIMFIVVLPTFAEIYKQMGVKLPFITVMMINISHFLRDYWFISFPLMGGVIWGGKTFVTSPYGKAIIDVQVMKMPVLGDLIKHTQTSQFVSTLFVAFGAGLPITDALYLATETITHTQMRAAFKIVNIQIQTGQRLATSLIKTGYVPDLVMLMISTGEESGDLEKMLETAYDYLEEEVSQRVEILTALMEPLMLLVIGMVVGVVALSIYLPLFSMYDHVK